MRDTLLLNLVSHALRVTRGAPERRLPTEPVRIDQLANDLIHAGAAEEGFALVVSMLDQHRSADRLFLSDLGEWLRLCPVSMRRMLEAGRVSGDLAA